MSTRGEKVALEMNMEELIAREIKQLRAENRKLKSQKEKLQARIKKMESGRKALARLAREVYNLAELIQDYDVSDVTGYDGYFCEGSLLDFLESKNGEGKANS